MTINTQINSTIEYLKSTVTLSSANLKAMYATPVLMIPAQGVNTIIVIHDVFYELVYTAPAYTGGNSGQIVLQYGNTAHAGSSNYANLSGTLLIVNANYINVGLEINNNLTGAISGIINTAIYASNITSAYATGNGLVNCTMFYSIINTIS
jgi:hypothetical protein